METRLPTKRMATACWAFIVAKRASREAAPLLVFRPLRRSNIRTLYTAYQQGGWRDCCNEGKPGCRVISSLKRREDAAILTAGCSNPRRTKSLCALTDFGSGENCKLRKHRVVGWDPFAADLVPP